MNNLINYIVYFILIIFISNTSELCFNPIYSYCTIILLLIIFAFRRRKFDIPIFFIFIYWFFINFLYSVVFNADFSFNKVLGGLIPLFLAYLPYKIIGNKFWMQFEKICFALTCIGMLFYFGQLFTGSLYDNLSSYFGGFISDYYKEARPTSWYNFFYTYLPIDNIAYIRNCGFMWEPGAFAMICVIMLIYRTLTLGVKIDIHSIIYILAILSTFSTAGYLALLLYFIIYLRSERNIFKWIIFLTLFIIIIPIVVQLEFMTSKLILFSQGINETNYNPRLNLIEYNRFGVFGINFNRLFEYPLGYGVNKITDNFGRDFAGVCGIAVFARMWGIIGFIYCIHAIYKTLSRFNTSKYKVYCIFSLIMIIIMFFSNPIEESPLLFILICPYIVKKSYQLSCQPI